MRSERAAEGVRFERESSGNLLPFETSRGLVGPCELVRAIGTKEEAPGGIHLPRRPDHMACSSSIARRTDTAPPMRGPLPGRRESTPSP